VIIQFVVPAVPIAQPRPRMSVVNGRIRVCSAYGLHGPVRAFKDTTALAAREAYDGPPLEGPISLIVVFVMPRVKTQMFKKKAMPRMWHCKTPDTDNLLKSLKDALTGVVWRDDSQVCICEVQKLIASGEEAPHVEVKIETL
jgi:Holliday junction resolvase RusA-like endonuclease